MIDSPVIKANKPRQKCNLVFMLNSKLKRREIFEKNNKINIRQVRLGQYIATTYNVLNKFLNFNTVLELCSNRNMDKSI